MNDEVERETIRHVEVWMERQRNERNHVNVLGPTFSLRKQLSPVTKEL